MALRRDRHTNDLDLSDINTVQFVEGIVNNEVASGFLGSSSHALVRTGATASLLSFGAGSFTITTWVMRLASGVFLTFLAKGTATPDVHTLEYRLAYNDATANLQWLVGNGTASQTVESSFSMVVNAWHFVVCIHDAALDELRIMVDGSAELATATWAGGSYVSGLDFALGRDGAGLTNFLYGRIDDTSVYSGVMLPSQVDYLYNGGVGRVYPFLFE